MANKTHGWVIEMKTKHSQGWQGFYSDLLETPYSGELASAKVFPTRKEAHRVLSGDNNEKVRKVVIDKNNKAIKLYRGIAC